MKPNLRQTTLKLLFQENLGPLGIDRMALGQGGLSSEPMVGVHFWYFMSHAWMI